MWPAAWTSPSGRSRRSWNSSTKATPSPSSPAIARIKPAGWTKSRSAKSRIVWPKLRLLADRKQTILRSIEAQGKLTEKLAKQILAATTTKRLEDLYLPFKPKKQTLATLARSRGLEELAKEILEAAPPAPTWTPAPATSSTPIARCPPAPTPCWAPATSWPSSSASGPICASGSAKSCSGPASSSRRRSAAKRQPAAPPTGGDASPAPAAETPTVEPADTTPVVETPAAETPAAEMPEMVTPAAEAAAMEAAVAEPPPAEPPAAEPPAVEPPPQDTSDLRQTESPSETPSPSVTSSTSETPGDSQSTGPESPSDQSSPPVETPPAETPPAETPSSFPIPNQPIPAVSRDDCEAASGRGCCEAASGRTPRQRSRTGQGRQAEQEGAQEEKGRGTPHQGLPRLLQLQRRDQKIPPHRVLAINRGERAKVLRVKIECDLEAMHAALDELLVPPEHPHADYLRGCARDALARLDPAGPGARGPPRADRSRRVARRGRVRPQPPQPAVAAADPQPPRAGGRSGLQERLQAGRPGPVRQRAGPRRDLPGRQAGPASRRPSRSRSS